jgi:uncharacterized protein (DUF488 family)
LESFLQSSIPIPLQGINFFMTKIVTIGAYGFNAEDFFEALQTAEVDVFCDIRWRRGVRGAEYAFVNSQRLQARLESLGITYIHRRDLAPPPEIRDKQKEADKAGKIAKRKRSSLSLDFVSAYREIILADFDAAKFLSQIPEGTRVVALFCVEREPSACHRSLLGERLLWADEVEVEHLLPVD